MSDEMDKVQALQEEIDALKKELAAMKAEKEAHAPVAPTASLEVISPSKIRLPMLISR